MEALVWLASNIMFKLLWVLRLPRYGQQPLGIEFDNHGVVYSLLEAPGLRIYSACQPRYSDFLASEKTFLDRSIGT